MKIRDVWIQTIYMLQVIRIPDNVHIAGQFEHRIKINNYKAQSVLKITKTQLLNCKYQLLFIYCCHIVEA